MKHRPAPLRTAHPPDPPKDFNEWSQWIHRNAKGNAKKEK